MIDFRYHLVSIVAVFFALAVGIVLGAGPLGERVADDLPARFDEMRQQNSDLQNQLLAFQTSQDYQQSFVDGVADELLSDRLTDETVLVVGLPGVDGDRLEQLRDVLARSGASVTGTLRVADSWSEPDSETALDTLAAELTTQPLPTDGDGYVRGASVLANTVLTSLRPEDVPTDPANGLDGVPDPSEWIVEESVLTAFSEAGLIEVNGELSTKANLVLVVARPTALAEPPEAEEGGESGDEGGKPQEWFDRFITLVEMFEQVGRGTVVAGERAAAAEHDVLGIIRGADGLRDDVSTVDSVELATGQVASVYALAEQSDEGSGHYGLTESADAQSPPIPPRRAPDSGEGDPDEGQPGETDGDAETGEDGDGEPEEPVGAGTVGGESGEDEES